MLQRCVAATCPMKFNLLNFMVELHGTHRGDKITPKLVLHNYKRISSNEGTCCCNISLKHVPATFSCVCTCCDFVSATCPATRPCYMPRYPSLLHVLATRRCYMSPQCALHTVFSLQHVAVTGPCNMTPRVFTISTVNPVGMEHS